MEEKNKRDTPDEQIQLSLPIPTGQVKAQQGETVVVAAAAPDPVPDPKGTESASEELNEIQTCSDNEEQRGREAVIQDTVITPDSTAQGANAKTESSIDKGHDFEASLAELEKIVNQLEGEVKLEEALNLFDRGMSLSRQCQDSLQEAEQRIEILKRAINGTLNADKFNEDILQNSQ